METSKRVTVTRTESHRIELRLSDIIAMLRVDGHEIPATFDVTVSVEGKEYPMYQHNPVVISWSMKSEREED